MPRIKPMDTDPTTQEQAALDSSMIPNVPSRSGPSGNNAASPSTKSAGNRIAERFQRTFLASAAFILTLTGIAKLVITSDDLPSLDEADPVLVFMTRRAITGASGLLETIVGIAIIVFRTRANPTLALSYLCSVFWLYRGALVLVAEPVPCGCLGDVANLLGLTESQASATALFLLAYLSIGTVTCMVQSRIHRVMARGPRQGPSPGEARLS